MDPVRMLGLMLGTAFASGLNLYATVATLGLLHRFDVIHLPPTLEVLAHPVVLGIAITLYVIEFVADKIPYVDNTWDVLHTFVRPPAAALLAFTAFGNVPDAWRVVAALLAGSVALASHGTKATTRTAVNASPEPVSNWIISLGEDGIALALAWFAVAHPLWTILVVAVLLGLSFYLMVKLFGTFRRVFRRLFRRTPQAAAPIPAGRGTP